MICTFVFCCCFKATASLLLLDFLCRTVINRNYTIGLTFSFLQYSPNVVHFNNNKFRRNEILEEYFWHSCCLKALTACMLLLGFLSRTAINRNYTIRLTFSFFQYPPNEIDFNNNKFTRNENLEEYFFVFVVSRR